MFHSTELILLYVDCIFTIIYIVLFITAGTLVVIGGSNEELSHNNVMQFDVYAGQVVRTVDALPAPYDIHKAGFAQNGNRVYIMGGGVSSQEYSNRTAHLEYGLWKELPNMKYDRQRPVAFVINDKLHVAACSCRHV